MLVICTLAVDNEKIVRKFQKLYEIKESKITCNFGIPQKYDIRDKKESIVQAPSLETFKQLIQ